MFALMEWWVLSQAGLLLNTYGSSFAVEASQVLYSIKGWLLMMESSCLLVSSGLCSAAVS